MKPGPFGKPAMNQRGFMSRRHRALEFRKFLDAIGTNVPNKLQIHMILDNYGMQLANDFAGFGV